MNFRCPRRPGICCVLALVLASCGGPAYEEGALSPERWADGEFERYWSLNLDRPDVIPDAESSSGLVVVTSSPLTSRVGLAVLDKGGSAVDAVLTQAMTQNVVYGGCCTSFAGVMNLLVYERATGEVHWLDAGWNTVLEEDEPETIPPTGTPSGRSAFVPGFMAGVEAAHARFGKLPFAALFEPAIYLAEEGFSVTPSLARFMAQREDVLGRLPETRAVFFGEDGTILEEEDRFVQPALAQTLRSVAHEGAGYMYRGEWAQRFVELVQREGGKLTNADLERYEAVWRTPLSGPYGSHQVFTPDPDILRLLYLADAADVGSLDHFSRSAEALERMLRVYSVRVLNFLPDSVVQEEFPGFDFGSSAAPPSPEGARALWDHIQAQDWPLAAGVEPEVSHSASIIAVDGEGNIAVLLHTINTVFWGTTGIFVDGVSISDIGAILGPYLDVAPGERVETASTVLIAMRDGTPALASGAVNHTLMTTFQAVTNVLDHGMTPGEAARMPFFFGPAGQVTEESPWDWFRTMGLIGDGFPPEVVQGLRDRGFEILEIPAFDRASPDVMAALSWIGVTFDPATGLYRGGTTSDCCGGWAIGR